MSDQTTADQTTADQTTADHTTADQTTADQTTADQTIPDQTTADQTTADQLIPDQTTADQLIPDQTIVEPPPNESSPLGTHISDMLYFNNTEWLVVDLYAKSSRWYPYSNANGGWDQGVITSTDDNGWPTGVTGDTVLIQEIMSGTYGRYPEGTYVLRWEGDGATFDLYNDASDLRCEDGGLVTNCPTRRAFFDVVTPTDVGIALEIQPDDPQTYSSSNYIRNIRAIMPGGVCGTSPSELDFTEYCETDRGGTGTCDPGETCFDFDEVHWNRFEDPVIEMHNPKVVFHPASLKALEKFRSLRMMNQMMIQSSPVSEWSDRALVTQYSLGLENGSPPEFQIALANVLSCDVWFNMPHLATDDFVTQFAVLAKANLDPNSKIFLEYTNEPFTVDPDFSQNVYVLEQAIALNIGVGLSDMERRVMYYATRAVEIFDLWHGVFADDPSRVVRVLANFIAMPELAPTMLEMPGIAAKADVLAIGAYFGVYLGYPDVEATVETWNLNQLFDEMNNGGLKSDESANGAMVEIFAYIDAHVSVAQQYGLDLVCYEGGPHLKPMETAEGNAALLALFAQASLDPRMGELYAQLLNYLKNAGAKVFHNFAHIKPSRFGTFGSMEFQDSDPLASPKYNALMEFIDANPCWWNDC